MRVSRPVVWATGFFAAIAVAGFFYIAHEPEIAPIEKPDPASFDTATVERGRVLANYGDCTACHTRPDGPAYAGNLPLKTPFGTIHTTNITPDPETGIGTWSKEAFRRSMKDGVGRDGRHLYPAFPYDHFTKVKDADIDAIYAYLMTQRAVKEVSKGHDFPFPLNIRATLWVWKAMFLDKTPIQADASKSAQWNEGAYLVEGLGHCGACHTPRNMLGAQTTPLYGGGIAEGWFAPPLNKDNLSQMPWTQKDLVVYLMDGWHADHGMAAGPMTPVVDALHKQNEIDVFAIAAYVETLRSGEKQIDEAAARVAAKKLNWGHPDAPALPQNVEDGARIFAARCAQCHNDRGGAIPLALQTSLHAPIPDTVAHAIANGIRPPIGALGKSMPAFGQVMTDAEIAAVVRFLRARYTARPAWPGVDEAVRAARGTEFAVP
jgi:mono/diheme cytochrome c family protein